MSYSQGNEQAVLAKLLPDEGDFLDIGAHDGKTFSNTLALAERGWTGVCVEPAPSVASRLLATHRNRAGITVVMAAVVPAKPGWATFWDSDTDCLSTLSTKHRDAWSEGRYTPLLVRTVTLRQLLGQVGYYFDFVSIDTEGSSVDLLDVLPVERMPKLKAVCVENDEPARLYGFEEAWRDGNNTILVRTP